jgi:phage gpG-like protein
VSKITDTDRGAREMVARIKALSASKASVRVGILSDAPKKEREGATGKLSLLEVAAVHEFGAPAAGIPQRSFIRATIDERADDIARLERALLAKVVSGEIALKSALDAVGAKVAGWIQQRIAAGIEPALSPATVAKKKSSTPLVDTGQLRRAVTWLVEGV